MEEQFKNLRVLCCWEDNGGYNCLVDMWDDWSKAWELDVPYVARAGDPAPCNVWILDQIATGAFDPIAACPVTDASVGG